MQCSYVGQFDILHSKKRRLMGSEMNRVLNATNKQKENASVYIRSEVNRLMKEGELCNILNFYYGPIVCCRNK